eukprot:TRINITY_DN19996_c0_g1_i1.p1 TRINITY_DN19996_c0_g1~~TRINITY_DN19996_c0_g1_i1.p1  ORF type:complete len:1848 (+),score=637.01 TRINITY_DN19996_c0_g1_i1:303-5546(+)
MVATLGALNDRHPTGADPDDDLLCMEEHALWGDGHAGNLVIKFIARDGDVKGHDVEDVMRGLVFFNHELPDALSERDKDKQKSNKPFGRAPSNIASDAGSDFGSIMKLDFTSTPVQDAPLWPARDPLRLQVELLTELEDPAGRLPYWMHGAVAMQFTPPLLTAPRAHAVHRLPSATAALPSAPRDKCTPILNHLNNMEGNRQFGGYSMMITPVSGCLAEDEIFVRDNKVTVQENWFSRGEYQIIEQGDVLDDVVCRRVAVAAPPPSPDDTDPPPAKPLRLEFDGDWTSKRIHALLKCVAFTTSGRVQGKRVFNVSLVPPTPPEVPPPVTSDAVAPHMDPPFVPHSAILVEVTVTELTGSTVCVGNEHWGALLTSQSPATIHRWTNRWQWREAWVPKSLPVHSGESSPTPSPSPSLSPAQSPDPGSGGITLSIASPGKASPARARPEPKELFYGHTALPPGMSRVTRAVYSDTLPFVIHRGSDRSQLPLHFLTYTREHATALFPFMEVLTEGGVEEYGTGCVTLTFASGYSDGDRLSFDGDLIDLLHEKKKVVRHCLAQKKKEEVPGLERHTSSAALMSFAKFRRATTVLSTMQMPTFSRSRRATCVMSAPPVDPMGASAAQWYPMKPAHGDVPGEGLAEKETTALEEERQLPNGGVQITFKNLSRRFLQRLLRSAQYVTKSGTPLPKPGTKIAQLQLKLTQKGMGALEDDDDGTEVLKERRAVKVLPPALASSAKTTVRYKEGDNWQPLPPMDVTKEKDTEFSFLDGGVLSIGVVGEGLTRAQALEDELTFHLPVAGKKGVPAIKKSGGYEIVEQGSGWNFIVKKEGKGEAKADQLVIGRFRQPPPGEPLLLHFGNPRVLGFTFKAMQYPPVPPKNELGMEVTQALGVKDEDSIHAVPRVAMKHLKGLLASVHYRNVSRDPSDVEKFIRVSVVDATGTWSEAAAELVTVAINDPTDIVLAYQKLTFTQDSDLNFEHGLPLCPDVNLVDVDTEATGPDGAFLSVDITGGKCAGDTVMLRPDDDSVEVVGRIVFIGGQEVGRIGGKKDGQKRPPALLIHLKPDVSLPMCTQVLKAIRFNNANVPARTGDRVLTLKFNAGDGVVDSKAKVEVSVEPPFLHCQRLFRHHRYTEGSGPVQIATRVHCGMLACPDVALVKLSVSFTEGAAAAEDELSLGPGALGFLHDTKAKALMVTEGGRPTKVADVEYSPMAITLSFVGNAYTAKTTPHKLVSAALQAIRYENLSNQPTEEERVLRLEVTVNPHKGDSKLYPQSLYQESGHVELRLSIIGVDEPTQIEPAAMTKTFSPYQGISSPPPFYPFADCSVEDPDTATFPAGSYLRVEAFAGSQGESVQHGRDALGLKLDLDVGMDVEPTATGRNIVLMGEDTAESRVIASVTDESKGQVVALMYDLFDCPLECLRELIRATTYTTLNRSMVKTSKVQVKVSVRGGDDGPVGKATVAVLVVPHAVEVPEKFLRFQHPCAGAEIPAEGKAWAVLPSCAASGLVDASRLVIIAEVKYDRWGGFADAPFTMNGGQAFVTDSIHVLTPGGDTDDGMSDGGADSPRSGSRMDRMPMDLGASMSLRGGAPILLSVQGDSILNGKDRVAEISREDNGKETSVKVTVRKTEHSAAQMLPALMSCFFVKSREMPLEAHDLHVLFTIKATAYESSKAMRSDREKKTPGASFQSTSQFAVRYFIPKEGKLVGVRRGLSEVSSAALRADQQVQAKSPGADAIPCSPLGSGLTSTLSAS